MVDRRSSHTYDDLVRCGCCRKKGLREALRTTLAFVSESFFMKPLECTVLVRLATVSASRHCSTKHSDGRLPNSGINWTGRRPMRLYDRTQSNRQELCARCA